MILMLFHIAVGSVALLSGGAAMLLGKGSPGHRLAGKVFLGAMVLMCATGIILSIQGMQWFSLFVAIITFYLVMTGWFAGSAQTAANALLLKLGLVFAMATMLGLLWIGWLASTDPDFIDGDFGDIAAANYYVLAIFPLWSAVQDLRCILRPALTAHQRIRRHLWRMGLALVIASAAFFLGQSDEFPKWLRGAHLFLPTLLALGATLYWLVRWRDRRRANASPPPASP